MIDASQKVQLTPCRCQSGLTLIQGDVISVTATDSKTLMIYLQTLKQ